MRIGELARKARVEASAIRYYESMGLLGKPARTSGRRVYDETSLFRLTFIAFAKEPGFSLREIRQLIGGFRVDRWKPLAERKLAELDALEGRIGVMRNLLREAVRCACLDVESCGRRLQEEEKGGLPRSR